MIYETEICGYVYEYIKNELLKQIIYQSPTFSCYNFC